MQRIFERLDDLEKEVDALTTRFNGVERELGSMATNFEKRLEALESRFKREGKRERE
jgi:hypothetical protein